MRGNSGYRLAITTIVNYPTGPPSAQHHRWTFDSVARRIAPIHEAPEPTSEPQVEVNLLGRVVGTRRTLRRLTPGIEAVATDFWLTGRARPWDPDSSFCVRPSSPSLRSDPYLDLSTPFDEG